MSGEKEFSEASWDFALNVYGATGVADACLRLQSEAGVDVMFMLVLLFSVSQKDMTITIGDVEALDQNCRAWREGVVKPLRIARTELKSAASTARGAEAQDLRSLVKANELQAERIQNNMLCDLLQTWPASPAKSVTNQLSDCLVAIVRYFGGSAPSADLSSDMVTLLQAALAAGGHAWQEKRADSSSRA